LVNVRLFGFLIFHYFLERRGRLWILHHASFTRRLKVVDARAYVSDTRVCRRSDKKIKRTYMIRSITASPLLMVKKSISVLLARSGRSPSDAIVLEVPLIAA